ncbi:NAD(P)-dependent alcohol dehydrogenase [Plantibacter sp. VKM Ac-2885]|uniref:NAD(P)-dependent alcohol dehydrogenase n=1 Tax=unclassified Plantibacter TaxID=2624265 RepID=UPI00177B259B|nr:MULTISPECIES: NAD(P)-dependent alcohol dehydrogenase [unclassified Plantibacter]MBD8101266.1 NAD(P)-dependent alcohol dehydrogenase [Plantibacter sp. CFBP 8775]MBD8536250.1 NAD(P)-dependent alcohol dehydrogenase [Plantibacter sp. CFBP 13570]MBF4511319.1 NAD(P)-dependent alcohol dehydrogenase [Plantibacter sp. VKM Ac-2885]
MKALRYTKIGSAPEVVEIEKPTPGPGEILLKVTAAGVCHSDDYVMSLPEEDYLAQQYPLPLTLGHEGAGVIESFGEGVETSLQIGDAVAVYGPWGCGHCLNCSQGKENYCTNAVAEGIRPPGLGSQGSMAEYMIVDDVRHLVPIGDLDPVKNVSLTDAGLTPYHAIKRSLPKLGAGTFAVVIGSGGLGHVGIQMLKALSGATVIVLDVSDEKLELAKHVGADVTLISDESAAGKIRELTGGVGVDAVFDFVGANPTIATATAVAAMEADVTIVGIGGGSATIGFGSIAYDAAVRVPYWGSRSELIEVFELAKAGKVDVEVQPYSLDDAPKAYEDLHAGTIRGRAVIVP